MRTYSSLGVLALLFGLTGAGCSKSSDQIVDTQAIGGALLGSAPIYSACLGFHQTEINCTTGDQSASTICSTTEMDRIRDGISPSAQRTDANAALFYECFTTCNAAFNVSVGCIKGSFNSISAYRSSQRSLTSNASIEWKSCYDSCKRSNSKIPPIGSGLEDLNLSFPSDPYGG
jgi:hypothetical protein